MRSANQRRQPRTKPSVKQLVAEVLLENVRKSGDTRSARLMAKMREYNLLAGEDGRTAPGDESLPSREEVKSAIIEALLERIRDEHDPTAVQLLGELDEFDFFVHHEDKPDGPFAWLCPDHPDHEAVMARIRALPLEDDDPDAPAASDAAAVETREPNAEL